MKSCRRNEKGEFVCRKCGTLLEEEEYTSFTHPDGPSGSCERVLTCTCGEQCCADRVGDRTSPTKPIKPPRG